MGIDGREEREERTKKRPDLLSDRVLKVVMMGRGEESIFRNGGVRSFTSDKVLKRLVGRLVILCGGATGQPGDREKNRDQKDTQDNSVKNGLHFFLLPILKFNRLAGYQSLLSSRSLKNFRVIIIF